MSNHVTEDLSDISDELLKKIFERSGLYITTIQRENNYCYLSIEPYSFNKNQPFTKTLILPVSMTDAIAILTHCWFQHGKEEAVKEIRKSLGLK